MTQVHCVMKGSEWAVGGAGGGSGVQAAAQCIM